MWIRIKTTYCVAAIEVLGQKIVDAAPIFKWAIGKNSLWLERYLREKGTLLSWEFLT